LLALLAAEGAPETPAASPPIPAKPVPVLVREVLADERFEYCHNPRYPLTDEEAKLCPLIVTSDQACPKLAEACKRGAGARKIETPKPREFELPDLGQIPRFVLFGLLGVLLGAVLYFVLRNVRPWQRRPKEPDAAEAAPVAAVVEVISPVETDVERLLASARAAAAAGDFARAIRDVHAALLRRLEGAGLVAVHPSRTNGDYVRAVARAKPALAAPVRSFVVDVERVQYGHGTATGELFQALLARFGQVSPDKLLVWALFAALSLGGMACGPDRGGWEYSPSGRAGVRQVLERAGRKVKERLVPVAKLKGEDTDAVVLLPGAELAQADWERLEAWVREEGGVLVLAGLPRGRPDWIGGQDADPKAAVRGEVVAAERFLEDHGPVTLLLPPAPALRVGSAYDPLLVRGANGPIYAAERAHEEGLIVALADDRLLTNGALTFADNARALVLLFSDLERIDLVGELTGYVAPNPVASVTRGRLAPFAVQLLGACVLFFLFRGVAFGRLREPPPPRRRSFVEHVEALGEQYARARAARHVLGSYGQWVVERLRERVALPAGSGLIALADAVAVRTGKSAGEVMRLLMEAREVPAPAAPGTAEEIAAHLAAVRQLGELLSFGTRAELRK
jgi:hypothetical protein